MILYSKSTASFPYRIELPELPRDYWTPDTKIIEAETIATSTSRAAMYRQVVKFDVTSITRKYTAILSRQKADYLITMLQSDQTSFVIHNGTSAFEVVMACDFTAANSQKTHVTFRFSVLAAIA